MATKTVILRPTMVRLQDDIPARNPSDVSDANLHTLIDEEIADDDATYVEVFNTLRYLFIIPFAFRGLTPTSIVLSIKGIALGSANYVGVAVFIKDGSNNVSLGTMDFTTSLWQQWDITVPSDNIPLVYECLQRNTDPLDGIFIGVENNHKSDPAITQMYLTLTFDVEDSGTDFPASFVTHIKENGTWTSFSGEIYEKINGAWVKTNATALANGTKYIVNKT